MKTILKFLFIFFASQAHSQVLVETSGKVLLGWPLDHVARPTRPCDVQVLSRNFPYNHGAKLAFGDMGIAAFHGINVFAGEFGNTDTDQLQLHGKMGVFLTTGSTGTSVAMSIDDNTARIFRPLVVQGIQITSDARTKSEVKPITDVSGLMKLNAVSYVQMPVELNGPALSGGDGTGPMTEKEKMAVAEAEKKGVRKPVGVPSVGFIAQEVKEIYPELVAEGSDGYLSLNYVGLIPVIVKNEQVQQAQIQALMSVNGMNGSNEDKGFAWASAVAPSSVKSPVAISYQLPEGVNEGLLQVFNMKGAIQKEYKLTANSGSVEIKAGEIPAGIFSYNLAFSGKSSPSLIMVRKP